MLEETIGYRFTNDTLLSVALTHSSYANEHREKKLENNERFEFLGDSILGFLTAEYLFERYASLAEGELTKLRAAVVCENSLQEMALTIGIDREIKLGKGEEAGGGRQRKSILADAFEALLGAIYLDGGLEAARGFAMRFIPEKVDLAAEGGVFTDYKTTLQEIVQKNREETLSYRLASEAGPDHDKRFTVELLLNSNVVARGEGRSKKQAEQLAAKRALELMGQ